MRFGLGLLLAALAAAAPVRAEELTAEDRQELAAYSYLEDMIDYTEKLHQQVYGQAILWEKLTGQVVCPNISGMLSGPDAVNLISRGPFTPLVTDGNSYPGNPFDLDAALIDIHIMAGLVTWNDRLGHLFACQEAMNKKLKSIGL